MRNAGDKTFRVCVFGATIESAATIADGIGADYATIGPTRPSTPAAMHIDAPASDDPLELIPFAARAYPRETLVLVRADTTLPPFAIDRLLRALECDGVLGADEY